MLVDYYSYQVNRRWYRLLWILLVAMQAIMILVYILEHQITGLAQSPYMFRVTDTALVIHSISLVYLLGPYWWLRRYGVPFAVLVGAMIFWMGLLSGLAETDGTSSTWFYVACWSITLFFNGLYGLPLLAGAIFLSYMYVFMQSDFSLAATTVTSRVILVNAMVVGIVSYWFWKRRYQSIESQQVNQLNRLSGQLRSNQQISETVIQSIADGVVMINPEGKITLLNPAAAAMTEWTASEAIGVDAQLVLKLTEENGAELAADKNPLNIALGNREHITNILELTGREGKKQTISLIISPVASNDANASMGVVAVMRDISEQRAIDKQRAEFISTASHEMRTPVAAIEGYLALALNDKVSTIDSRARGFLEKAHVSTQHLGKLFQDLLTSSKAEDGRLSNHPVVVEMSAFMQQLSDDLRFAAEKKGLSSEFVIGGADETIDATTKDAASQHLVKPLFYVHVDPERMREVVTNLFDNACKYTDSGKVSIGLTGDAEVVQLYIRDTGAGIPAEDIPHLFQKFYRVDNSATRTVGGTGLGLFICRKIIELYQGRIWVESQVGVGSTFFINLPRLSAQRANELQSAQASLTTSTAVKS